MSKGKGGRSPARNPQYAYSAVDKRKDYTSNGVNDNNIFKLPPVDWAVLSVLTVVALAVRLFRLYQPTSVVFDEVQYVNRCPTMHRQWRLT